MPFKTAHVFLLRGVLVAAKEIAYRGQVFSLPRRMEQKHVGSIKCVHRLASRGLELPLCCLRCVSSFARPCFGLRQLLLCGLPLTFDLIEFHLRNIQTLHGIGPLLGVLPQEAAED